MCRIESGLFSAAGALVTPRRHLQCGDFDGDGNADLVLSVEPGQGLVPTVALVSLSLDGGPGPLSTLPSVAPPAVLDLDGDGADDLAFISSSTATTTGAGLSVLRGLPTHGFEPKLFSTALGGTEAWPVNVELPQWQTLVVTTTAGATQLRTLGGTALASWPRTGILGPIEGGSFDESAQSCGAVALGFSGEASYRLKQLCVNGQVDPAATESLVTLSEPLVLPPQVLDLDGDHHLDVLAVTASGAQVSFGDGRGGFRAPVKLVLSIDGLTRPWLSTLLAHASAAGGQLLVLDEVIVQLVPVSVSGDTWTAQPKVLVRRVLGTWTAALAADLDGDGVLELAATSGDASIDLFRWEGATPTRKTLVAGGPVTALASGDLDGDGRADLAWVERTSDEALQVAFGEPGAFPTEPILAARAARFSRVHAGLADATVRLMAVLPGTSEDRLATWRSEGRALTTVVSLSDQARSALGLSVTVGAFGGAHRGVAVAGLDLAPVLNAPPVDRWWSIDLEAATATAGAPLDSVSFSSSGGTGSPRFGVASVAGSLDGGTGDTLVSLAASQGDAGASLTLSSLLNGAFQSVSQPLPALTFTPDARSQLLLVELTGDSQLDLVVLAKGPGDQRALLLCPAAQADACTSLAISGTPEAIALLGTRVGRALTVLTDTGVHYALPGNGPLVPRTVPNVPGGVSLAIGDANGDGLDDLFISDGATVTRYLSIGAHQ